MKKKKEAVGKYIADFLRTLGIGMMLFSIIGLAMNRDEAVNNIAYTVTFLVLGWVMVFAGGGVVLLSTISE